MYMSARAAIERTDGRKDSAGIHISARKNKKKRPLGRFLPTLRFADYCAFFPVSVKLRDVPKVSVPVNVSVSMTIASTFTVLVFPPNVTGYEKVT